jgi:hypothetical protein
MNDSGDDFDIDAFLASSRPALGLCDFELIGDRLFNVGVAVGSPLEFKKMVFAAGKIQRFQPRLKHIESDDANVPF